MMQIILCSSTNSSFTACFFSFGYRSRIRQQEYMGNGAGHWNASWLVPPFKPFLIQLEIISFMSIQNWSYFETSRALSVSSSFCLSFWSKWTLKEVKEYCTTCSIRNKLYSIAWLCFLTSLAQTRNEIICNQTVLLSFLSPSPLLIEC